MDNILNLQESKLDLATPKVHSIVAEVEVLNSVDNIRILAEELNANYSVMLSIRGGSNPLTDDEIFKFMVTSIYYRVLYTRKHSHEYISFVKDSYHPHLLGILVANIGKCYDEDSGLELIPAIPQNVNQFLLKEDEMHEISRKFKSFRQFGVSVGDEFPKDKSGDFKTMSFSYIEGEIKREDKTAHPIHAVLAALSGIHLAESFITPRITYISKDNVKLLVKAAAQFESPR